MTQPAAGSFLIRDAEILTMDETLGDLLGDILVQNGVIAAVGTGLEPGSVPVINASHLVVMPGMVDTHRHTWQAVMRFRALGWTLAEYIEDLQQLVAPHFTPEDVYAGNLLGAVTALDAGITTLRDDSHVQNSRAHGEAAVQALRDSGIRASFGHGWPSSTEYMTDSGLPHPESLEWMRSTLLPDDTGLVTMHAHLRGPSLSTVSQAADDLRRARELGLRSSIHIGAELLPELREVAVLAELDLLGPDQTFVHCCTTSMEDLRVMAAHGCTASVCATIEAVMPGLGRPATGRLLAAGLRPTLGVDVEVAAGGDLFSVMRSALASHQLLGTIEPEYVGEHGRLTARDLLSFATIDGARACGLDDRTGSLVPGKQADIIMFRRRDLNLWSASDSASAIVAAGHPGNVDTVFVGGEPRKYHGTLVGNGRAELDRLVAASSARLDMVPSR